MGVTQANLATALGITRPYLSGIEHGKHRVSGEIMIKISRTLGVKVEELFFLDDSENVGLFTDV